MSDAGRLLPVDRSQREQPGLAAEAGMTRYQ